MNCNPFFQQVPLSFSPGALVAALVALSLPLASLSAQDSPDSPVVDLDEVTLRADDEMAEAYAIDRASAFTKIRAPLSEMPISAQVVSRQALDEQDADGLEDVYRNVSGVAESGNTLNAQSEIRPVIRGFESPVVLRNGLRATTVGAVDLANIESVEVLKGPASILFGALEPGGVLNYTTKKPQEEPSFRLEQEFGSYGRFRSEADATGPLNAQRTLLYRVNAAYTDTESFRNEIELERIIVAPTLAWRISESSEVGFEFSYTKEEVPLDNGIPLGADGKPLVDDDTFFGDPDLEGRRLEDWFASYELEHRFSESFALRHRFQYHLSEPRNQGLRHRGVVGPPGSEELRQRFQDEDREDEEYQTTLELTGEFATGGLRHNAVVGFDYINNQLDFDRFRQNVPNVPISSNPDVNFEPPAGRVLAPAFREETEWIAVYAHDQLSLLDEGRLKLLIGGRFDSVDQEDKLDGNETDESEFTGRFGALYALNDWLSPYASIAQSFLPQGPGTQDREGNQLEPETGIQYEAGLKFSLFEGDLRATLAGYQLEKEDVAVFDRDFFVETGEIAFLAGVDQRSRGVELDVTGQISESLRVIANYAYTDAEETDNATDPARIGSRLGNVPRHAIRLWSAYDFADGSPLEGLGLGIGLRYEDERLAQFDDAIEIDDFFVVDVALWRRFELKKGRSLTARVNVKNLFDERFITRASTQDIAHPGAPASVNASFVLEF